MTIYTCSWYERCSKIWSLVGLSPQQKKGKRPKMKIPCYYFCPGLRKTPQTLRLFNESRMIWWLIFFMFDIAYLCYCAIDWRWLFKRLSFLSYRDWHFFFIVIRQGLLCCRIVESWRNIPKPLFRLFSVLVKARMDISFWPIKCCLAKTSSLVNVRVKKNWSCKCITSRSVLLPLYSVPFCRYTRGLVQFKQ